MKNRKSLISYIKQKAFSGTAVCLSAVVLSCTVPIPAAADTDSQNAEQTESQDAGQAENGSSSEAVVPADINISGDTIEYDQIKAWIRQYNPVIKSANESYYMLAEEALRVAEELRDEANDLYEQAKDLDDVGTEEAKESAKYLRKNVRELRKYAKKQQDAAEDMDESSTSGRRQLNHTEDTMTYNVQVLMNTYWQLQSQRAVAAKNVQAAQAAFDASQALTAQGMAVESGLLASAGNLGSAKASLTAIDASIEQVKRNIYTLTGQGYASGMKIGTVPEADLSRIDRIDLEKDCQAAVGNNYELIVKRHTDLSVKTNKTANSRLREIEDAEAQMEITIRGLYQDVLRERAEYNGAKAAYESALITWNGAQIQNQQGMLGRTEFLQQEAAFLSAQSAYQVAGLEMTQTMEIYDWAVKGLVVSSSES